jgi:glycerophosphoryl diester phosphodiesterase
VQLIGHRGSKAENIPENSVMAFKRAMMVGVDVIELDVWLTSDKEVVVFHDGAFKRMCGGIDGHVNDTAFADLPSLVPETEECAENARKLEKEQFKRFAKGDAFRIPKFSEVLALIPPEMGLIVEFKDDRDVDLLIEKTQALLKDVGRTTAGNTVVFSLKMRINKKLQQACPTLPTICSVEEFLITYIYYYLGILPFMALSYNIFGCTSQKITAEVIKEELDAMPMWLCRLLNVFVGGKPSKAFMCPNVVDHLADRACPCWLLGVNEEVDVPIIPKLHASGCLTDRPGWLKEKMGKGGGLGFGGQLDGEAAAAVDASDVKLDV